MKASTYKDIINLISDPDTMTDGIAKLQAQLDIDEEDYNKVLQRNNNLLKENNKLVLKNTNLVSTEKSPEEIEADYNKQLETEFLAMFNKEEA